MGEIAPFLVPIVVPSVLFLSIATAVILRGPLGKAIGERVAGHKLDGDAAAQTEALHAEVDELRFRLSEVEERLDFTERLLARQGGPEALPKEEH
jgi:hypothetical protein